MTTRPGYIWSGTEWVSIGQEAVVAPVSYQTSAPSTPSTGDIWIDSNDDVPGIDTSQFLRWRKTAAGSETSLSGTDDTGLTLAYTANYEQVYLNGVLLVRGQDYTATNGTSITGLTALAANDVVEVFGVVARVVGDVYTQAQTNSLLDAKSNVSTTGLVLLNTTTVGSAVASVTISNVFSSSYGNYRIIIDSVDATNVTNFRIRFGSITTGYYGSQLYDSYGGGATGTDRTNNGSSLIIGVTGLADNSYTSLDVYAPNLAKVMALSGTYYGGGYSGWYAGEEVSTTQHTAFTILPGTGTFTGGTIKVYGYK